MNRLVRRSEAANGHIPSAGQGTRPAVLMQGDNTGLKS
jgi:hypothetical protein